MEEFFNPSGTSLLVPSVQELVKERISEVPQRYVQPQHEDMVVISKEVNSGLQIPVIDMQNLLSLESGSSELDKLHFACKEWGFFQLINHGLSFSLLEKVKLEMQDFFNLPMSEKRKLWQSPQHMEGFGQAFVISADQKLDWGDLFYMTTLPTHSRMPHLFPQLPLPFRDTLEIYLWNMKNIAMVIIAHIRKALRIEEMEIMELFEDGLGLTILLQVNDVEGLQIRKDEAWVPIMPMPNAFVVNVGDILEIMTNGIYRSIEHRATVNSEMERLSIATFYSPRQDVLIGPLPSLITKQTPAQFKSIGTKQYFKDFFARKLEGKSHRDVMRIKHQN
ncbi:protein SRG1-like isoform X2 [Abrus precatorius]|uniref:Protein SRG1-like isoform X2 n=1 Tax=Abrus precatorius TaxID=3816 RepID=A0A8B8KCY1_ABRPR|nr:protein SRG1-like isoform X2 [Abrus precatorius]